MAKPRALALIPFLAAACASAPEASISITTGEEADAFSRSPAPTELVVEAIGLDSVATEIGRTTLPADSLSLGDRARTDVAALRVTARDPGGTPLLRGETLFFQYGALEGASFEVFVQRAGELARLPRATAALEDPVAVLSLQRYVMLASGASSTLYDLLLLKPLGFAPAMRRPPKSVVTYESVAYVIDETGATTIDLTTDARTENDAPSGGTFADVAGGATVQTPDGSSYVVGATRRTGATTRILKLDKDGKASFVNLGTPREGACATWVEGRGLVVYGGSATGPSAEVLAPGLTVAAPLPFPPDPIVGCGAAALTPQHVVIAGGATGGAIAKRPPRVIDLACTTACTPFAWPNDLALGRASVVALNPEAALVVGDEANGESRVVRVSSRDQRPVPLKVARRGAKVIALPTKGHFAVVGGAAAIEQYLE